MPRPSPRTSSTSSKRRRLGSLLPLSAARVYSMVDLPSPPTRRLASPVFDPLPAASWCHYPNPCSRRVVRPPTRPLVCGARVSVVCVVSCGAVERVCVVAVVRALGFVYCAELFCARSALSAAAARTLRRLRIPFHSLTHVSLHARHLIPCSSRFPWLGQPHTHLHQRSTSYVRCVWCGVVTLPRCESVGAVK